MTASLNVTGDTTSTQRLVVSRIRQDGDNGFVRDEKGQSLVELAFVLPVLLLVLAGIFDVGRSLQSYVVILNASREVAMRGAAKDVETDVLRTLALDEITRGGLDSSQAAVVVQYQLRGFPEDNHIIVQVNYELPLLMAVLSFDTINLSATTEMVVFW